MLQPGAPVKVQIPRWIQLVVLPLLLLFLWTVAAHLQHVIFLFIVSSLLALLLGPAVRRVAKHLRLPRGVAIGIVYLTMLVGLFAALGGIGTVIVDQTRAAGAHVDDYFTKIDAGTGQADADRDVDRFQRWLDSRGIAVDVEERGHELVQEIRDKDIAKYTTRLVGFLEGAAVGVGLAIFDFVLVVFISIYMLLGAPRLGRMLRSRFPPREGSRPLLQRMEHALVSYVKGQLLLSVIIGSSAGLGLWAFDLLGLLPGIGSYILLFAAWVAFMELIPYVGPWLGSLPPFIYALFTEPISAIWVALLFLFIHQVESNVVVPNVMSRAVQLHPLLVIFGLLGGLELYGLAGALIVLPLAATGRAAFQFFAERVELESWRAGATVPVEVEVEPPRGGDPPAAPPDPPAPAATPPAPPAAPAD